MELGAAGRDRRAVLGAERPGQPAKQVGGQQRRVAGNGEDEVQALAAREAKRRGDAGDRTPALSVDQEWHVGDRAELAAILAADDALVGYGADLIQLDPEITQ